jgi:hypothetical protein
VGAEVEVVLLGPFLALVDYLLVGCLH